MNGEYLQGAGDVGEEALQRPEASQPSLCKASSPTPTARAEGASTTGEAESAKRSEGCGASERSFAPSAAPPAAAASAEKTREIAEHYAQVARDVGAQTQAAAGAGCECCEPDPAHAGEAFSLYAAEVLEGLPQGALAASRGCGDPVAKASLAPGERVLDLGSGGGIDALIAARLVGAKGHVYGLDMTPDMIELARKNAAEAGIDNVDFIEGSIDAIPLPDGCVDVVLSNCVVNLVEDKSRVFAEAKRVLAPGGRIVVSDIVGFEEIPEGARDALATITGCRRGITAASDYRAMLTTCGFESVSIEPKTVYTTEVLREKATRKGRMAAFEAASAFDIDAVCGSAIVCARVADEGTPDRKSAHA